MKKVTKWKPYPKYKPSGIDWIGDIPDGWEKKRIKYISKLNADVLPENTDENFEFYYIDIGNVSFEKGFLKGNKIIFSEAPSRARRIVRQGDTIVSTVRTYLKAIVYIETEENDLIASTGFAVVSPLKDVDNKFLYYALCCERVIQTISAFSVGISYPAINVSDLGTIFIVFPNKYDQQQIADFLDKKTAQIDGLIQKKEEMVRLLKERRTAIINQAVTKGLDPNVEMKDSGVKWLGNIPKHWEMKKLKYLADIILGKMLMTSNKEGYSFKPYLRANNLKWLSVDVSDVKEMWFSDYELSVYRLEKGDLLVSEGGEVGRTCIWNEELAECYIQNSVNRVRLSSKVNQIYFLYHFFVFGKLGYFNAIVNKVSIAHLTKEKLVDIKFLVPPFDEQKEIADYINFNLKKIDALISSIKVGVDKLNEYKTSLISEAVTGKIDVRNYKEEPACP